MPLNIVDNDGTTLSKPLYTSGLHPIILLWPVILLLVGLGILLTTSFIPLGVLFSLAGALSVAQAALGIYCSQFCIYPQHLEVATGVWVRDVVSIPARSIETIEVRQSVVGALLNYGSLLVIGTGGTVNAFRHLRYPLTCRRQLEKMVNYGASNPA